MGDVVACGNIQHFESYWLSLGVSSGSCFITHGEVLKIFRESSYMYGVYIYIYGGRFIIWFVYKNRRKLHIISYTGWGMFPPVKKIDIMNVLLWNLVGVVKYPGGDTSLSFSWVTSLTHWGWVAHMCVGKLTTIGSDNGLSPGWRQAIIWTNAGISLIRTLGIKFIEILSETHTFSFKKMHLKCLLWNGVHFASASMCYQIEATESCLKFSSRDINISLIFVTKSPVYDNPTLVQATAWHEIGSKSLHRPLMTWFTDIYLRCQDSAN